MISIYLTFTIGYIIYLVFESILLDKARKNIPLRILVNGTRGKTTMVHLICKVLKNSGLTVIGKTTGDIPLIINADSTTSVFKRFGPASIIENVRWLRQIARQKPDAVVLECMALQSETQRFLGQHIFKSHFIIITNILYDHAEVMGQLKVEMAKTLGQCIAPDSHVILNSDSYHLLLESGIPLSKYSISLSESAMANSFKLKYFPSSIIEQQQGLLQSLGKELNIPAEKMDSAIYEYWNTIDDKVSFDIPLKKFKFYDLFSVNDMESTKLIFNHITQDLSNDIRIITILNIRSDRPFRTRDLCQFLENENQIDKIWLMGSGKYLAKNLLKNRQNILPITEKEIIKKISEGFIESTSIIGIGNHKGTNCLLNMMCNLAEDHKKEFV